MTLRPSLEGFIRFVRDDMKVPVHAIADDDPTLECCFQSAMELIPHDQGLERLPIIYVRTVYNAAASFLLNFAPGSWFADLRKKLNLGKLAIYNTAITNVQDMTFAGGEPGVAITITGTYYINSEMWDLV
ncbi:TPA: hypothetical protein JXS40_004293 [Escherichia coli]|uniref:hypothetical protein n=1 Tax=Escherichia coli TaxID=562 RepID=UPI000BDF23EB|nr:hypothetical protein [Escherichia coli]EET7760191.1 hypothetical protein [Escherichia coli]EFH8582779.1 hypothetical protein [Escherichia coli]EFI3708075.1 hypothetical protein [Escherichia coli]EFI4435610.1 hypothetical protein [Escherichia coli]EFI5416222.1 hypothetical protein [Escherichia coli]